MTLLTTTPTTRGLLPSQIGPLLVQPMLSASVFAALATRVSTTAHEFHIPVVSADGTAQWVAEGAEIAPSDPTLDEIVVTPAKLAGLSIVSRELADDSSPAAAQVVGDSLARDLARRLDQAVFAGLSAPAPAGLTSLSGIQTYVAAGAFSNLDWAAQAISKAEQVGATVTHFIAGPSTALTLSTVKQGSGSNAPLLGLDATSATSRSILGVPLLVSQFVPPNVVWAIDGSRTWLVVRKMQPFYRIDRYSSLLTGLPSAR